MSKRRRTWFILVKAAGELGIAIASHWLLDAHPLWKEIQIGVLCFLAGGNLAWWTARKMQEEKRF